MSYLHNKRGPLYHWVKDLLRRMDLPVFDGVPEVLKMLNENREALLKERKTEKSKLLRKRYKMQRKVHEKKRREQEKWRRSRLLKK